MLKNITHVRQSRGKKYLVTGNMVKAPKLNSPVTKIPLEFPNQGIDMALKVPAIQYSAWESDDGSVGLVLTNIGKNIVDVEIPLSPDNFDAMEELNLEKKNLVVSTRGEKEVLPIPESEVLSLELQPRKVTLLEIKDSQL